MNFKALFFLVLIVSVSKIYSMDVVQPQPPLSCFEQCRNFAKRYGMPVFDLVAGIAITGVSAEGIRLSCVDDDFTFACPSWIHMLTGCVGIIVGTTGIIKLLKRRLENLRAARAVVVV